MDDDRTHERPGLSGAQPEPVVARLRTPGDLVVATPYLVGFRPEASLVVVGTGGPRRRVQVTMRLDLPPDRTDRGAMAAVVGCLVPALQRSDADAAQLLVYPGPGEDPGACAGRLPRTRLVRLLAEELVAAGIALQEAVCVVPAADGADRYWSYLCCDPGCCPAQGTVISEQEALDVRFAFVSAGRTVRPGRAELVASLAPTTDGERTAELLRRVAHASSGRPGPGADPDRVRRWRRGTSRALGAALAAAPAGADDVLRLDLRDTALLAVGVADRPVRDVIIAEAVRPGRLDLLTDVLGELVRCLPDELLASAAGTLAAVAYCNGDGALAWVAVDRAVAADPEQSLAVLVAELLGQALPPEQLRGFLSLLPSAADWDGEVVPVSRAGSGPRTGTARGPGPRRGVRRRAG